MAKDKCDRCEYLNRLLQKERKDVVSLKDKLEAARDVSKRRKKLIDEAMLAQADGVKMAEAAVDHLLFHLADLYTNKKHEYLLERIAKHRGALRSKALSALDNWTNTNNSVHKAIAKRATEAGRGERSIPRRGKYSS